MNKEITTSKIGIPNFRQKLKDNLKNILNSINCTSDHKVSIKIEALRILDNFISRAEKNEFTIRKNINLKSIASAII